MQQQSTEKHYWIIYNNVLELNIIITAWQLHFYERQLLKIIYDIRQWVCYLNYTVQYLITIT